MQSDKGGDLDTDRECHMACIKKTKTAMTQSSSGDLGSQPQRNKQTKNHPATMIEHLAMV